MDYNLDDDPYAWYHDDNDIRIIPTVEDLRTSPLEDILFGILSMAYLGAGVGAGIWCYTSLLDTNNFTEKFPTFLGSLREPMIVTSKVTISAILGGISSLVTMGGSIAGVALYQVLTGRDFLTKQYNQKYHGDKDNK